MLTDTVEVAPHTGQDAYGVATYGPPVARPARIQRRMKTTFGPAGRMLVPETRVYLDSDVAIGDTDRVTMPDGTQPPIQDIETHKDEMGNTAHYVLFF